MHIIIAAISAIAALLFALNRLQDAGINLNSFNPFFWYRRHKWQQQLGTKPIHALTDPLEAAAVLLVGIAFVEGEITRELKRELMAVFESEMHVSPDTAAELYSAMSHMLRDEPNLVAEIGNILAPSLEQFNSERSRSLLGMLERIAGAEGAASERQREYLDAVRTVLDTGQPREAKSW